MTTAVQYPNWFAITAEPLFEKYLLPLAGTPGLRFLQIGVFTGDASVWLLDNVLTGPDCLLIDVDTWEGSDEAIHKSFDWSAVERFYDERTVEARQSMRLEKWTGTSEEFWPVVGYPYDFIYIDGAHDAYTVLNDGISAYKVLKPGGLLAFDDYLWRSGKGDPHDPALAIDSIGSCYQGRLTPIEVGQQVWFRRSA